MTKFFRRIRYDLMEKNKTGKYLKYAIGEIILVIIGILIAVSINGWNEDRKFKIEEQSMLKDLRQEMSINLEALEAAIDENKKSFQAAVEMRALYNDREAFNEISDSTFVGLIEKLNWNATYDPQNGILNSIISSGQINQIADKELKYLLASLKEKTTDALEDANKIEDQRDELMRSCWSSALIIKDNKIQGYNVKAMFDNPDLLWVTNHLFYGVRENGLEEEHELKSTLEYIIELIDQNIKK